MEDRCFFLHDKRVATSSKHDSWWLCRSNCETLLSRGGKKNNKDEMTSCAPAYDYCNGSNSSHPGLMTSRSANNLQHKQQPSQGNRDDISNHDCSSRSNSYTLMANSHVDWHSHSKLSHDNIGHPFGKNFLNPIQSLPKFHEFYNAIINKHKKFSILSKHQAIQIVRKMRHNSPISPRYNYRETHKLSNAQVCMVIQEKRVFNLISSSHVEEMYTTADAAASCSSLSSGENKIDEEVKNQYHHDTGGGQRLVIVAREVMFEPSKDDDCEDVDIAIIFTLSDQHDTLLQKLTARELKTINKVKKRMQSNALPLELNMFQLCCPRDEEAYDLVSHVLDHACESVVLEEFNCHFMIASTYNQLANEFNALMNHFALFHWPVNENEEIKVTQQEMTLPNFDTMYNVSSLSSAHHTVNLWKSFRKNLCEHGDLLLCNINECNHHEEHHRLSVFLKLSSNPGYHDTITNR